MKIESMNLDDDKRKEVSDYSPDVAKTYYDLYFNNVNDTSEWRISKNLAFFVLRVFNG